MITPEPFFEPRGTPISVYHRTKALSNLGYSIDFLTYHVGQNVQLKNTRIVRIAKLPFVRKIKIGPSYIKILLDLFLLFKAISLCIKKKYDFIHVHEEASVIGILLKKLFKIPLIYDMHSSMPQQLINYGFTSSKAVINLFANFEKKVIENSDAVIAISPDLKNIADSIHAGKTKLIENTIVFSGKSSKRDIIRLKRKLGIANEKVILYTGTFESNQGLDILLQTVPLVLEQEKNIKYVLVGGQPSQIEELKALAKELNVENYVLFTGQRQFQEISLFLSMADILVSPRNKGTNTPLKIYSYINSGKPIVATNIYSHTQVLTPKISILADANHKSFANGILKLLQNEKLREKLGKKALKVAKEMYGQKDYANKLKQAYLEVYNQVKHAEIKNF